MKAGLPPATKGYIASLQPAAWYQFGTSITNSTTFTWGDCSGNGRNLTATGAARPTINTDGSIQFDGVADVLAVSFAIVAPATAYIFFRQDSWTAGEVVFDGAPAASIAALIQAGTTPALVIGTGATTIGPSLVPSIGAYCAMMVRWGTSNTVPSAQQTMIYPRTYDGISGTSGVTSIGGVTLGADGSAAASFANVSIKEFMIFPLAHVGSMHRRVMRYLNYLNPVGKV